MMRRGSQPSSNYFKVFGVSGLAMLTALVSAQTVAAQVQSTEIIDNEDGSSQVIVTVERRAQSLQDYAGTAAAITGEDLNLLGIDSIGELDGKIPGLSIANNQGNICLLYTSPSPRDKRQSRMPSSA